MLIERRNFAKSGHTGNNHRIIITSLENSKSYIVFLRKNQTAFCVANCRSQLKQLVRQRFLRFAVINKQIKILIYWIKSVLNFHSSTSESFNDSQLYSCIFPIINLFDVFALQILFEQRPLFLYFRLFNTQLKVIKCSI